MQLFWLRLSATHPSADFRDEITLLRVTPRRGNDRFTLHSCTQARQATLWVTIGSAGTAPRESNSLTAVDEERERRRQNRRSRGESGSLSRSFNKSLTPGRVTFDSPVLGKYYGLVPAARQSVVPSHDSARFSSLSASLSFSL